MPSAPINQDSHLYLIDASAYIFRAYHALPPLSRASDGLPIGAVSGFCNMLWKLLEDLKGPERPSHFACVFDKSSYTFRNDIYPDYKANRDEPPADLKPQFDYVRQAAIAFHTHALQMEGYEADDLIATYAKQAAAKGARVTIVSSDKDLMQLVTDRIQMLDTMKNKRIGITEVVEKFGVEPDRVIDVQALAGDSVDNIPGAPGIGVKTAATLLHDFGDLDALLTRAGEIKQPKRRETLLGFAEQIRLSKRLVTLDQNVPVEIELEALAVQDPDPDTLLKFLESMELRTITRRVRETLQNDGIMAEQTSAATAFDRSKYELVRDLDTLDIWITKARKQGYFAIDTETDALDAQTSRLVGVSLAVDANEACYVPLQHIDPEAQATGDMFGPEPPQQINMQAALARLQPILEDPSILKIGQNIKYDISVLKRYGLDITPIDDTMLLSFVLHAGMHGHGMDELAERYFSHTPITFKDVCGSGKAQISFDRVSLDKATEYAAEDADITLRLWHLMKPKLHQQGVTTVYETLERPLMRVLSNMEAAGIKVDAQQLSQLSAGFAQRMAALEDEAYQQAGRSFNMGSPKQLGEILFDEMELPGGKKTKTGAWQTGAEILEDLAAEGQPLPRTILGWRSLSKLRSTYTETLQEQINPATGRVHTNYSMTGAQTGRLSSNDPNLQNIPIRTDEGRKIREAFIAEPGNQLVSADYSQIELRLLAHIADIDALKSAFRNGLDIHAMTASEMFNVPIEGMDPMIRRRAKAINFGIIYGISAFGLARQLSIPRSEASDYIKAYFEKFPGIKAYMEDTKAKARANKTVETAFGRVLHLKGIDSKNGAERSFAERQAINAPIQGSAADIIKRAMIAVPPALEKAGLKATMLLQVHDELIFETPANETEALLKIVTETMERAPLPALNLSVPLIVEASAGKNWSEAH